MTAFLIFYILAGHIVSFGKMAIHDHLYSGDNFIKDYLRLAAFWPLVVFGVYR